MLFAQRFGDVEIGGVDRVIAAAQAEDAPVEALAPAFADAVEAQPGDVVIARGKGHEQSSRIAATGNGDQQAHRALETFEKTAGCLDDGNFRAGHGLGFVRNQQDRRLCSDVTLLFTALDAFG